MPGFIADSIHQGYGYLDQTGYVGMARPYVEKVRNTVPLADRAARRAEEIVPPLITRADELAEPTIVKMRPYVEPRIEQVRETVTPYVNKGVETCEQIKDFTETKTSQLKEFKDRQVTHVKDFTDAKATQIKKLTDPPVKKIKNVVEPHLTAGKIQGQKLLRVAGCDNLQDLKCKTVLDKIACALSKAELLLDKYLPVPIERPDSDSTENDTSCTKIQKSVHAIKNHLGCALMMKIRFLLSLPMVFKTSFEDGSMKEKVVSFCTDAKGTFISKIDCAKTQAKIFIASWKDPKTAVKPVLERFKAKLVLEVEVVKGKAHVLRAQVSDQLASIPVKAKPTVTKVAKNPHFIKAVQVAFNSIAKILGKEKTVALVEKIESCIPSVWKTTSKEVSPKKKQVNESTKSK